MISAPLLDPTTFHRDDLPTRLAAGNGALAAADVAGIPAIGFVVDGARFAYRAAAAGGAIDVFEDVPGDAGVVVILSGQAWSDFVQQLRSAAALALAGELGYEVGDYDRLARWEPALRAMYTGRPIYDAARADLDGLDLTRSFRLGVDPDDEIADHFHRAGFVHLRRVFTDNEIDELNGVVDLLAAEARPGDDTSWWATQASGEQVLCRLVYCGLRSERVATLEHDPRVARIFELSGYDQQPSHDRMEGTSVVLKPADVVAGLADLPWHQDCGLGGHPILCPSVAIGIQLSAATPESGQLHFIAGSQGMTCHQLRPRDLPHLPHVAVTTEPGDVTVHIADVMHAAPPPQGRGAERRTMYISGYPATLFEHVGPGEAYNDIVRRQRADGQADTSALGR